MRPVNLQQQATHPRKNHGIFYQNIASKKRQNTKERKQLFFCFCHVQLKSDNLIGRGSLWVTSSNVLKTEQELNELFQSDQHKMLGNICNPRMDLQLDLEHPLATHVHVNYDTWLCCRMIQMSCICQNEDFKALIDLSCPFIFGPASFSTFDPVCCKLKCVRRESCAWKS